jgi:hypothetical protein
VLFLAQNKELMQKIGPALSFVEEHRDSLALFKDLLEQKHSPAPQPVPPPDLHPEIPRKEERSPLQGIASDEILKEIQTYLSTQK